MDSDRTIKLSDGRRLGFATYGDPDGRPVLALHGTPGSRFKFADTDEAARKRGLRILAVDRWGYGMSSPKPDARLAAFGADMLALADALGFDRCSMVGVSGGGPYAAAAAAALGPRLQALALVAPVGPIGDRTRLSLVHRLGFRVLPPLGFAIPAVFHLQRAGTMVAPGLAVRLAFALAAPADRRALTRPQVRNGLARAISEGLRPGVAGPVTDMMLFSRPWEVKFDAIAAPTRIWIGTNDRNVPLAGVQNLHAAIKGSNLTKLDGEGHLWIAENGAAVMDWLANHT